MAKYVMKWRVIKAVGTVTEVFCNCDSEQECYEIINNSDGIYEDEHGIIWYLDADNYNEICN